jgi:PAS domain-containing protein
MESGKSVGWEWDLKTNRDTWFGDLSTMFGIPSNVYDGHVEDFRRSVHPEDRGLVWKAVKDATETRSPYETEFRVVWPDGTVRWVAARGQFYYSPGGDPERMLGMAVDITERKDAEESLRRKEMELKNPSASLESAAGSGIRIATRSCGQKSSIASPAAIRTCRP